MLVLSVVRSAWTHWPFQQRGGSDVIDLGCSWVGPRCARCRSGVALTGAIAEVALVLWDRGAVHRLARLTAAGDVVGIQGVFVMLGLVGRVALLG